MNDNDLKHELALLVGRVAHHYGDLATLDMLKNIHAALARGILSDERLPLAADLMREPA